MQIQNTTQPTFGKLYMPEYKILAKKYGKRLANVLESQREAGEKAASKYDIYFSSAFACYNKDLVFLEAAPLKSDNKPRKTSLISCHYPLSANNLSKSIKKFIKEKEEVLLSDTLVEKELATETDAHSFLMNYSIATLQLLDAILKAHDLGNEQEKKQLIEKTELIKKTLAKFGLITKSDEKSIIPLHINNLMRRMIKNGIPLKSVMEELQNIGMHMPINEIW